MKIEEAINYYGSSSGLAKALEVTRACVSRWKSIGYIPTAQQFFLERLTHGKLMADGKPEKTQYTLTPKALDLRATKLHDLLSREGIGLSYRACREIITRDNGFSGLESFEEYWSQRGGKRAAS